MSKSLKTLLLAALITSQAGASGTRDVPRGIAPPTRIPDAPPPAEQTGTPVATAAVPRAVRRAVVSDAARRFGVAESAVVLARAERITWRDGSLGCAQPGQMYTQSLVKGFRVAATTSQGEFIYHTDSHDQVLVCARAAD